MQELSLTPKELKELLRTAIPNHMKVFITGPPATAKTSVAKQVAAELGYVTIVDHFVTRKPTDFTGIPWISGTGKTRTAEYFPIGKLAKVLAATVPTVWLMDDLPHGKEAVQAAAMTPLLDREIEGRALPDCVSVIATGNRSSDKTGAHATLETVKSRFDTIVTMTIDNTNRDQWLLDFIDNWLGNDLPPEPIAFLRNRVDALYEYSPSSDMKNFPNLRTWESVGKWLKHGLSKKLWLKTFTGAIGSGRALEFVEFLETVNDFPDLQDIIDNPMTAAIPDRRKLSVLYLVCSGLAALANPNNFENILAYAERLRSENLGTYGALIVQDSLRRRKTLYQTRAFIEMVDTENGSELGRLISSTQQG